jgi:hypothetical protein
MVESRRNSSLNSTWKLSPSFHPDPEYSTHEDQHTSQPAAWCLSMNEQHVLFCHFLTLLSIDVYVSFPQRRFNFGLSIEF